MLSVKEKIIAGIIAIILIITIGVCIIIQIAKFSSAGVESMNINNAIIQMSQFKDIIEVDINEVIPTENNIATMSQYIKNGEAYVNDNLDNQSTHEYAKLVSETIKSLQGYGTTTQIERGEIQQKITTELQRLYTQRGSIKVNYGVNGIILILVALGLIVEVVYLYVRIRKTI